MTVSVSTSEVVETRIEECRSLLITAAETKQEDPELVVQALTDLEKLMREQCKLEPETSQRVLEQLNGSWRLVFSKFGKFCPEVVVHRVIVQSLP
jgi:hypothetical protein